MKKKKKLIILLTFLTFSFIASFGQTRQTGKLDGRVIDINSKPLPGVEVAISSPSLMQPKLVTITNVEGMYYFPALPPGEYRIEYKLPGFKILVREGIQVRVGVTTSLRITMEMSPLEERVVVKGESPMVDLESSKVSVSLTSEFLKNLPTSRDIWVNLQYSPGIITSRFDVGGNTTGTQTGYETYGQSAQNRPLIDGVDTTEGTSGSGFYFDFAGIEEVQLTTFAADAERKVPGLTYQMIVKSGGNEFHGQAYFDYEDENFAKKTNIDDELRKKGVTVGTRMRTYYEYSGNLGGRIVKDKLWFFTSLRRQAAAKYVVGYFHPDGKQGDDFTNLDNITGKLTWQINKNNKLDLFMMWGNKHFPERGGSRFVPPESTSEQNSPTQASKLHYTRIFSENAFLEVIAGKFGYNWPMAPHTDKPAGYDVGTGMYFGSQPAWYGATLAANWFLARRRYQLNIVGNYYTEKLIKGKHDFRFGVEVLNEQGKRRIVGFPGHVYHYLKYGKALYVELYNTPVRTDDRLWTYSTFIQDNWALTKRLVLNLGLRWDAYENYIPEQFSPAGRFAPERKFREIRNVINWSDIAPRIGASYDLTGDGKTALKALFGRYYHNPSIGPSEAANPNALERKRYTWVDRNGNGYYDPGEEVSLITVLGGRFQRVDPKLKHPYTDEYGIILEREIIPYIGLRVGYLVKESKNFDQTINAAWPYNAFNIPVTVTDPGEDGIKGTADDRTLTLYNLNPAYKGKSDNLLTNVPGFKEKADNIEIYLMKRPHRGWMLMGSFVATHKKELRLPTVDRGVAVDPNSAIHNSADFWYWTGKLVGSVELPFKIGLSGTYTYQRGMRYGRRVQFTGFNQGLVTVWAEPYGSKFTPSVNLINLRIGRDFPIYKKHSLEVRLDVFNLLNSNTITSVDSITRVGFPRILEILPPRIARIGFTYKF
ncbi:MAG: TonB-dependent receptor [Acidobacteriota bacterium]